MATLLMSAVGVLALTASSLLFPALVAHRVSHLPPPLRNHPDHESVRSPRDPWHADPATTSGVGLFRSLRRLGLEAIGARIGTGRSAVSAMGALHARLMTGDAEYGRRVAGPRSVEGGGK
ncbi:MAG: hypothetical protein AAF368_03100 [Planctomycetota bacterium]